MRRFKLVFLLLLISVVIIIPFACTPTVEKPIEDSFFVPVDTLIRKNVKSDSLPPAQVDNQAEIVDENIKKSLAETLLDQDRRLDDIIRQMDMVSKEESIDASFHQESNRFSTEIKIDKKISNEVLLEMIRQRNQRLEDVIGRLNLFTQNQQKEHYRADSIRQAITSNPPKKDVLPKASGPRYSDDSHIINTPNIPVQQPVSPSEANSDYANAIQLYKQQRYTKAIQAFQMILKQGVGITLQDNCHFWIGVCYFNLKRTNHAIGEFLKVIDIPASDKKEGAYFMIGQCYEQRGAKNYAAVIFKKMIKEYPQGDLKQVAEIKLALLR